MDIKLCCPDRKQLKNAGGSWSGVLVFSSSPFANKGVDKFDADGKYSNYLRDLELCREHEVVAKLCSLGGPGRRGVVQV